MDDWDNKNEEGTAAIANCVLFSLLQFADIIYVLELVEGLLSLKRFLEWLEKRDCAEIEGMIYDENLRKIASHWIRRAIPCLAGFRRYSGGVRLLGCSASTSYRAIAKILETVGSYQYTILLNRVQHTLLPEIMRDARSKSMCLS
jgi:hypothetical protein